MNTMLRTTPLLVLAMAVVTPAACSSKDHAKQKAVAIDSGTPGNGSASSCVRGGGRCLTGFSTCRHTGPQDDCPGPDGFCCVDAVFAECDQGITFPIIASDYDQSCNQDSDCIGIGEGNGCDCLVNCRNAAINVKDEARWQKDVEKVPARATICHCPPLVSGPCCVDHRCSVDRAMCERSPVQDSDGAGEDAGGPADCVAAGGKCVFEAGACQHVGRQDCSLAHGICCLDR